MLEVEMHKQRRGMTVEVGFSLAAGGALALFGPSGTGKTTVLNCIAGLETPDDGRIVVDGQIWYPPPLALDRRALGYLAQQPCLFPHLSVAENVTFGLTRPERRGAVSPWIGELRQRLGLEGYWEAPARELSGGQAQRVALGRMLARKPPLLLLDEPFAGLDRDSVCELVQAIRDWRKQLGFTLVAVDHQAGLLEELTDRVIFLQAGRVQPPMRTMARPGF
ncbi:MAG: ATP-binding cassette domain-containing protein [Terriglobales bacterium]